MCLQPVDLSTHSAPTRPELPSSRANTEVHDSSGREIYRIFSRGIDRTPFVFACTYQVAGSSQKSLRVTFQVGKSVGACAPVFMGRMIIMRAFLGAWGFSAIIQYYWRWLRERLTKSGTHSGELSLVPQLGICNLNCSGLKPYIWSENWASRIQDSFQTTVCLTPPFCSKARAKKCCCDFAYLFQVHRDLGGSCPPLPAT